MLQNFIVTVLIFIFSGAFALVFGQTPVVAIKPSVIVGDVVALDDYKIVVNSSTGAVEIIITDKSVFKRVSAEKPSLTEAIPGVLTDIGIGDRLTVSGILSEDGKSLPARSVYFMTAVDIAAKHTKENEEWLRRGIKGKVVSVSPQTNQITVEISGLTGTTKMTLTPKAGARFLRYAQDSVEFDEALDSSLGEVKVNDMLRAIGEKSTDGLAFSAEKVLTGAFQTIAGTIKSIDPETNEIVIKNLQNNKDVTVLIGAMSVLKRFPTEQAEMLARMQMMGAGGARPVGQAGGARPQAPAGGQRAAPGAGQGGFSGARTAGGIDDILERSPTINPSELKVGEIIAFSSTRTAEVNRIRAIKLFAGVEPFLRSAQAASGGRRGMGGVEGGFSIPGLEGP